MEAKRGLPHAISRSMISERGACWVAAAHASFMALQAARTLTYGHHPVYDGPVAPDAPMVQEWITSIKFSFGYYAADLMRMAWFGILDPVYVIHHVYCYITFLQPVLAPGVAVGETAFAYLIELSTPLLCYREYLKLHGHGASRRFKYATRLLCVLFFFVRILLPFFGWVSSFKSAPVIVIGYDVTWLGQYFFWPFAIVGNSVFLRALLRSASRKSQ